MRAIKKVKNILFTIHESVWWIVSEIEDWLYPYKDRLTPEESFQIRVKDFDTGENYMVEDQNPEECTDSKLSAHPWYLSTSRLVQTLPS